MISGGLFATGCHTHRKRDHNNHGMPEYVRCCDCNDLIVCTGYMGFDDEIPTSPVPIDVREQEMRNRGQR